MNISQFVEQGKEKAIRYDFENEIEYDNELWKVARKYFDADRSSLALQIYAILWGQKLSPVKSNLDAYDFRRQNFKTNTSGHLFFSGETLNSYNTTFGRKSRMNNQWDANFFNISGDQAKEYCAVTHSLGNFMPVPQIPYFSFNGKRGWSTYIKDYWDLTLLAIRNWYTDSTQNKPQIQNWLEGNKEWLQLFAGWKDFIDSHYLKDFVTGEEYNVIFFWEEHSFENVRLRKDQTKEAGQFRTRTTELILKRGATLYDELVKCLSLINSK